MINPRDRAFVELRNEGHSNAEIAEKYGISRERVRQVLKRLNYVGKPDFQYKLNTPEELEKSKANKRKAIYSWQKRNPAKKNAYYRKYVNKRIRQDEDFAMRKKLGRRIRDALAKYGGEKADRTMDLIGCSVKELRTHLESQFEHGMNWENWTVNGWHIDHIRPCASFDLTDPEQQRQCFHYSNLQPLWAEDNIKKSDTWEGN
jgi:predicted DNA-binding protein YlxM (UPF0122 family)